MNKTSRKIRRILQKTGILFFAFRVYELFKVAEYSILCRNRKYWIKVKPDGLPIPPLRYIMLVIGVPDIALFLERGRLISQAIIDILKRNKLDIDNFKNVLEFGCGCGRILRNWKTLKNTKLYGTDYNKTLVDWCRCNLGFAQFQVNNLYPPINYPDEKFDLIYVISVFTHFSESLQFLWVKELIRILRPGGYLIITTLGEHCFKESLTLYEQEQFRNGKLVVRYKEGDGSNLCVAYHPKIYVQKELAKELKIIDFIPGAVIGNPSQDIFLLKKPEKVSFSIKAE